MRTRIHDETGMMGKLVIVWILLLVLMGIAAVDTVSIVFTTFHLADVGSQAASDGEAQYRTGGGAAQACSAAEATVRRLDETIRLPKIGFCTVDPATSNVTITLKQTARTILAGRLDYTKHYALVVHSETAAPSAL